MQYSKLYIYNILFRFNIVNNECVLYVGKNIINLIAFVHGEIVHNNNWIQHNTAFCLNRHFY